MNEIETLWDTKIKSELELLATSNIETEEYRARIDEIGRMMDKKLEMKKFEADRRDRMIKNIISCAGIGLPLIVTIWGTLVSLNFEREGVVTTGAGRGFISKLFNLK